MKQGERELSFSSGMSYVLNKYLLGTSHVPGCVLQVGDTTVSKMGIGSLRPPAAYGLQVEADKSNELHIGLNAKEKNK